MFSASLVPFSRARAQRKQIEKDIRDLRQFTLEGDVSSDADEESPLIPERGKLTFGIRTSDPSAASESSTPSGNATVGCRVLASEASNTAPDLHWSRSSTLFSYRSSEYSNGSRANLAEGATAKSRSASPLRAPATRERHASRSNSQSSRFSTDGYYGGSVPEVPGGLVGPLVLEPEEMGPWADLTPQQDPCRPSQQGSRADGLWSDENPWADA